jgi:hypothetical protein
LERFCPPVGFEPDYLVVAVDNSDDDDDYDDK